MRGQLFSFDFILAVSLIIFLLAVTFFVSDATANSINLRERQSELQDLAQSALSQLLESPGTPSNWHLVEFSNANIKSIGLSSERNRLDPNKTEEFFRLANLNSGNYSLMRSILALDASGSNFSLSIYNASQFALYEISQKPGGMSTVISMQRLALLSGEPVVVNLKLWVEK